MSFLEKFKGELFTKMSVSELQTYEEIEKEWRAYRKEHAFCNSITTIEVVEFVRQKIRSLTT